MVGYYFFAPFFVELILEFLLNSIFFSFCFLIWSFDLLTNQSAVVINLRLFGLMLCFSGNLLRDPY